MNASRRRRLFRLAALALVPALLVALELGLRVSGALMPAPPQLPGGWARGHLKVSSSVRQQLLERQGSGDAARVRTSRRMVRDHFMHDVAFAPRPGPGTLRVFCFGGSATLGVPVENRPGQPFPDRLQHHLAQAGVQAEVYNLGGASFGSDQVVTLVKEVVKYGPTALVVYSANNEFFNYHLELVQHNRAWVAAPLRRLKVLELGHRALRWSGISAAPDAPADDPRDPQASVRRQEALVAGVMGDTLQRMAPGSATARLPGGRLERADVHHAAVVKRYAANLEAMARLAGAAPNKVSLLLVEVPRNLRNKPVLSLSDPNLGAVAAMRLARALDRGKQAAGAGQHQQAAAAYGEALELDPGYAAAHFGRGQAWLRLGRRAAAVKDLEHAVELDMNPGRPVQAQSRAVRQVAARHAHVTHVDLEPALKVHQDPGRGRQIFHDICHLTPRGYDLVAQQVAAALLKQLK